MHVGNVVALVKIQMAVVLARFSLYMMVLQIVMVLAAE
jgi:hypothetical protein